MSKSPEYEPYQPSERDENGRMPAADRDDQRYSTGRIEIRTPRSLTRQRRKAAYMHMIRQQRSRLRHEKGSSIFKLKSEGIVIGTSAVAICVSAIAMLAEGSDNSPDKDLSPVERFENDYISYDMSDCLKDTAYDVTAARQGKSSVTPPSATYDASAGTLTVIPVGGDNKLQLDGFTQFDHTITPLHDSDKAILETYGCEIENY